MVIEVAVVIGIVMFIAGTVLGVLIGRESMADLLTCKCPYCGSNETLEADGQTQDIFEGDWECDNCHRLYRICPLKQNWPDGELF